MNAFLNSKTVTNHDSCGKQLDLTSTISLLLYVFTYLVCIASSQAPLQSCSCCFFVYFLALVQLKGFLLSLAFGFVFVGSDELRICSLLDERHTGAAVCLLMLPVLEVQKLANKFDTATVPSS